MPKYTDADRARALAALYASVDVVDGEPIPNFRAVSKQPEMPTHPTLAKWWRERDVAGDLSRLTALQRAREEATQQGADLWIQSRLTDLQAGVEFVLHEDHRTHQHVPRMVNGEEVIVYDYPVRPDQMARAYKDVLHTLKGMQELLTTGGGRDHHTRVRRLRESVKRVGLARKKAKG